MSKRKAPITVDEPSMQPVADAPELEPNDALILMLLARYPKQDPTLAHSLFSMLSPEGKLIAQALTGKADKKSLPASVIATAEGLQNWVKSQMSPSGNRSPRVKRRLSLKANAEVPDKKQAEQKVEDLEPVLA